MAARKKAPEEPKIKKAGGEPVTTTGILDECHKLRQEIERHKNRVALYKKEMEDKQLAAEKSIRMWHAATDALIMQVAIQMGKPDPETGGYVLELQPPDAAKLAKQYSIHAVKTDDVYRVSVVPRSRAGDDKKEGGE